MNYAFFAFAFYSYAYLVDARGYEVDCKGGRAFNNPFCPVVLS